MHQLYYSDMHLVNQSIIENQMEIGPIQLTYNNDSLAI